MTVIRPNSISGINSITGSGGDINLFRADGTAADLIVNNVTSGIVTATTFVGGHSGNGANLTNLPAGNLTGNLPAISAANLTSIPAANITGTLPAISATNLTNVPAANITGTLPAIDGSALTGVGVGTADSINTSGIVTATAFVSTEQGSASFRNLVHNGNMYINQRGVTSSTSTGHITCDRWRTWHYAHGATCTTSISDVASGTNPYTEGHRKAYKFAMSGSASAAAGSSVFMAHGVEAQNVAQCGWDYKSTTSFITVQFWVKASHAQSYTATVMTPDSTGHRNYGYSFALSANTWTKVIKTIPGDSNLLFNNDNGTGLAFYIYAWIGDDYDNITSADTWVPYDGDEYSLPISSGWLLSSSPTFEVTGVQIEVGKVATSYEHRSPVTELQLCQRYYHQTQGRMSWMTNVNATDHHKPIQFPVTMRTSPSVSFYDLSVDGSGANAQNVTPNGYACRLQGNGRHASWQHKAAAEI